MTHAFKFGDAVTIVGTEESCPRVLNARAEIVELTAWGAHVETPATETGRYRAHISEIMPFDPPETRRKPREAGYTGDACKCGSFRVRRNGACLLCDDCGETSGCS